MSTQQNNIIFPSDAHSFEVFAIKDCKDSPTGKEAYIGYKLANGNFHFVSVPFTEPNQKYKDTLEILKEKVRKAIDVIQELPIDEVSKQGGISALKLILNEE